MAARVEARVEYLRVGNTHVCCCWSAGLFSWSWVETISTLNHHPRQPRAKITMKITTIYIKACANQYVITKGFINNGAVCRVFRRNISPSTLETPTTFARHCTPPSYNWQRTHRFIERWDRVGPT